MTTNNAGTPQTERNNRQRNETSNEEKTTENHPENKTTNSATHKGKGGTTLTSTQEHPMKDTVPHKAKETHQTTPKFRSTKLTDRISGKDQENEKTTQADQPPKDHNGSNKPIQHIPHLDHSDTESTTYEIEDNMDTDDTNKMDYIHANKTLEHSKEILQKDNPNKHDNQTLVPRMGQLCD
jgi:hypothetical protein